MDPGYTLGYNNIVVNTATNARSEQDLPDPSSGSIRRLPVRFEAEADLGWPRLTNDLTWLLYYYYL